MDANIKLLDGNGQATIHEGIETMSFDTDVENEKAIFTHGTATTTSVELDFTKGDQVIVPEEGNLLVEVMVKKPDTLVPENILKGVDIGGVVGILTPPQLYAPTISKSGNAIIVDKTAQNGNFGNGYNLYDGDVLVATQESEVFDVSYLDFEKHIFTATVIGDMFMESPKSEVITVAKYTLTLELTNLTSNAPSHVWHEETITFNLFCEDEYGLPRSISRVISSINDENNCNISYDYISGKIAISNITGDIKISASALPKKQYFTLKQGQLSIYASNGYLQTGSKTRVSHVTTDVVLKPGVTYKLSGVSGVRYGIHQVLESGYNLIINNSNMNNNYKLDSGWQTTGYEFTANSSSRIAWITASYSSGNITPEKAMPVYIEEV